METIRIFDTTLRDGEQSPGCSMSAKEKLLLARQLDRLGVDVIEAGFAASSPGDFESIKQIGQQISRAKVVSLCRASLSDIERAVDALKESENWGIHTFIASSQLNMKYKLQMDEDEVLKPRLKPLSLRNTQITSNSVQRMQPEVNQNSWLSFSLLSCEPEQNPQCAGHCRLYNT